jgi:hypothetical protein
VKALSGAPIAIAALALHQLPLTFSTKPAIDSWQEYGIDPRSDWSASGAVKALVAHIAESSSAEKIPFDQQVWVEKAIKPVLGTDPSSLTPESLASVLGSAEQYRFVRSLFEEAIADVVRTRWKTTGIEDSSLAVMIEKEFVPWLLQSIEELAKSKSVGLQDLPSQIAGWATDLERQRLSLRSTH